MEGGGSSFFHGACAFFLLQLNSIGWSQMRKRLSDNKHFCYQKYVRRAENLYLKTESLTAVPSSPTANPILVQGRWSPQSAQRHGGHFKAYKRNLDLNRRLHLIMETIYFSTDIQYCVMHWKFQDGFWSKSTIYNITSFLDLFPAPLLHSETLHHLGCLQYILRMKQDKETVSQPRWCHLHAGQPGFTLTFL